MSAGKPCVDGGRLPLVLRLCEAEGAFSGRSFCSKQNVANALALNPKPASSLQS